MDGCFFLLCVEGSVQVEGRLLEKEMSVKIRLTKKISLSQKTRLMGQIGLMFCRVVFGGKVVGEEADQ